MVSEAALRGYLLEEVLAWLLRNSGYELLSAADDVDALKMTPRGLAVRGRGAWHQADVLGEFRYVPPFSLPVRLFLEAKFTRNKCGLGVVRNGHGVVHDVNENLVSVRRPSGGEVSGERPRRPRASYRYSYALFSTSGFTADAQMYALAHQLSLIDLSIVEFREMTDAVAEATRVIHPIVQASPGFQALISVKTIREAFRLKLNDEFVPADGVHVNVALSLDALAGSLRRRSTFGLVLAFPAAPFVLGLVADNLRSVVNYCLERPTHQVNIRPVYRSAGDRTWTVSPVARPDAYRMTFGLPRHLEQWIADQDEGTRSRVRWAKENLLSAMTIYWLDDGHAHVFRLQYVPSALRRG
ncbi:hypothetical protein [Parafrankia sp. EUN1f]|uniref:hypothetical protein n=1 Tax=Parafrankia sp. EUN1f TaxID=102897 RepID=UPI0001C45FAD|nr:hypothetical protein [Parafrankia sp. EUN1f]EFC81420.1 hypothetical protein FrEUN1fDRAFT_5472 [Parafrankia sp. EUN1f]